MSHLISWTEIPVQNIERAIKFYSKVLDIEIIREDIDDKYQYAYFDIAEGQPGAALICGSGYEPAGKKGPLIYFAVGDINWVLDQVTLHGGIVQVPKTATGDGGSYAQFQDSEGNRVGVRD